MKANLARLLTAEQGRPLFLAEDEIAAGQLWFDKMPDMRLDDSVIHEDEQSRVVLRHLPLGCSVAVVPWNYPV